MQRSLAAAALLLALPVAAHAAAPEYGADVPFITYEAEQLQNTGKVMRVVGYPSNYKTPMMEASGRAYVELTEPGQYIELTADSDANHLAVRNCIPDAPAGGGISATLSVYVNGERRQTITLSSKHNWLYGNKDNGQSNDPAEGQPHVFWDDAFAFLDTPVKPGDVIRLQKDESDDAKFYRIDLVDLELVAPPLAQPADSLSVADYGATGDDDSDDTEAITKALADANAQGKSVFIPAGTYHQSAKFRLEGHTVHGAGMFHTTLVGIQPGSDFAGTLGFTLAGDGDTVTDMTIRSAVDTSRSRQGNKPFTGVYGTTKNFHVENVLIHNTNVGMWLSGCDHGVVRNCRVHLTYADGINLNRGSSDCLVENNYVRGIGDDGVVILGGIDNTVNGVKIINKVPVNDTLRRNTVIANWWGRNANVDAGDGHLVEDNYFADNSRNAVLSANNTSAYPANPITSTTMRHNLLVRGGNTDGNRGALWINAGGATFDNIVLADNRIVDAMNFGIALTGKLAQHVEARNNVIENPARHAILITGDVTGSGTFIDNTVRGLQPGFEAIHCDGGDAYKFTETGTTVE